MLILVSCAVKVLLSLAHEYNISDLKDRAEITICESLDGWKSCRQAYACAQDITVEAEDSLVVNFEEILEIAHR